MRTWPTELVGQTHVQDPTKSGLRTVFFYVLPFQWYAFSVYQQPIPDLCDRNFLTHTDVSDKKEKEGIIINKIYSYRLKLSTPYEKSTSET